MLTGDIEDEVRYGIDDISRRGLREPDDDWAGGGGGGRRGRAWTLAGGGGQGIDLMGLLFAWFDALAGLAGAFLSILRRI